MTVYTEEEAVTHMLRTGSIVDSDASPSANDLDWGTTLFRSEVGLLASIGMPIWNGSVMAVPEEYMNILARRVWLAAEPTFGLSSVANAQLAMREAERYLTVMAAPRMATPSALRSNDAMQRYSSFNYTTGR